MEFDIECRTGMVLRAVCLVTELGVVSVTILRLASGSDPNESDLDKQKEWGAVMASLATTVVAFFLSLFGAGSALSGAKVVAARVSSILRPSVSKSGQQ